MKDPLQPLLNAHARSFALSLRLLPKELRKPLSLGYLLARCSDTIADANRIPRERRLELLSELQGRLGRNELLDWNSEFKQGEISISERELMDAIPMLMEELEKSADRAELLQLWQMIVRGQIFDLQRFDETAQPLSRAELETYCYLVAGSVGETWTRLIAVHSPKTLLLPKEEMVKLGISYGKGLQLLNILRDRAADRELWRVYVKEGCMQEVITQAASWLSEGEKYCLCLRPGQIRFASLLPLLLAQRTLKLIRDHPEAEGVKISRGEVYRVLLSTLPSLVLRRY